MDSFKVAIYSVTFNRPSYTLRIFEELKKSVTIPYDHFVIDNASNEETVRILESKRSQIKQLVLNKTNQGICIAQNQILDAIGDRYDYIIKVDPDMEFLSSGWVEELIKVSRELNDKVVLSPYVDYCETQLGKEKFEEKYGISRYQHICAAGHKIGLTYHVGGMVRFAQSRIYNGYRWETDLPIHTIEDPLFSAHCKEAGYLLGYVEDITAIHNTPLHIKEHAKYYKNRHFQNYIQPNRKYNLVGKIGIFIKGINYYYSDFGNGASSLIGRAVIPSKRFMKKLLGLQRK